MRLNKWADELLAIYWNCIIGTIEIPALPKIPDIDVTVNTRNLNYRNKTKKCSYGTLNPIKTSILEWVESNIDYFSPK